MEFVFASGRPSLDFVGTLMWRRRPEPTEQLTEPADLGRWCTEAGLVDRPPQVDGRSLSAALELREQVYRVLDARRRGKALRRADVAAVNRIAAGTPITRRLTASGRVQTEGDIGQLLTSLAVDVLTLLADDEALGRLRECENADCTRLYVDTSRAGTRRWCGMSGCGNRAKVARFRERHAAPSS
jgi:predicted RNA-binding Zn ribbon-like protein